MCKAYDQSAVAAIMKEHACRSARPLVKKKMSRDIVCVRGMSLGYYHLCKANGRDILYVYNVHKVKSRVVIYMQSV